MRALKHTWMHISRKGIFVMRKEEAARLIRQTMDLLGQNFDQVWTENKELFAGILTRTEALEMVFRIAPGSAIGADG